MGKPRYAIGLDAGSERTRCLVGALENSHAHVAVAITGVAGPGGGTPMKPVGTVHFATARANQSVHHRMEIWDEDDRETIQLKAVQTALELLRERLR